MVINQNPMFTCWSQDGCAVKIRRVRRWPVRQGEKQWHIDTGLHVKDDGHVRVRDVDLTQSFRVSLQHNSIVHHRWSAWTRHKDLEEPGDKASQYEDRASDSFFSSTKGCKMRMWSQIFIQFDLTQGRTSVNKRERKRNIQMYWWSKLDWWHCVWPSVENLVLVAITCTAKAESTEFMLIPCLPKMVKP